MEKTIETLTIDIETTGLPPKGADYETQYDKFPRIVEFAYKINDEPVQSAIINQQGFVIPDDVIKIHGITNDIANASTYKLKDIINRILAEGVGAKFIVGHNIYFETSIIKANTIRLCKTGEIPPESYDAMNTLLDKDKRIDTVRKGMVLTKKWPKLHELYHFLFKKEFNRHHAADDCQATYECYIELKKRGLA
jgi:DNA polymerase III epsilon subunit-like protein